MVFSEVTRSAGIDFVHENGAYGKKLYPERMGAGAAFFDADGDGLLDVLLVNGTSLPGHPRPGGRTLRLYLNRGGGRFEDRTGGSGLESLAYGMGVAVGDVDNDGDEDLFLTRVGRCALYLNQGGGTFRETPAGVEIEGYSSSAAFLDFDRDGLLDLYVCRYIPWRTPKDEFICRDEQGRREYCTVHVYPGMEHRLFRGVGGGRFADVTRAAGIAGHVGRGLAVVCGDYDRDGDTDILVANDETPNFLWQNQGRGRFTELAAAVGFAYNERGLATAGMGLDFADVDGNGTDDVIESDFQGVRKTLYVNKGGFFTANAENKGLGDMPLQRLGFGIGFLDYDLDGWPDIFIANGHVNDDVDHDGSGVTYAQTAQLFRNLGGGRFVENSSHLGSYGRARRVGRGAAFGDFDNDGDTDILVSNNNEEPALLRNDIPHRHHWLGLRCIGTKSGTSAYGTRVSVQAGERLYQDETRAASSYLSSSDSRLLFGLGREAFVANITIQWPSGTTQTFKNVPVDRYLVAREGTDALTPGAATPAR